MTACKARTNVSNTKRIIIMVQEQAYL